MLAVVAALMVTLALAPASHAVGTPQSEQREHAAQIAELFDLHNAERQRIGLQPLVLSPSLSLAITQPFTNAMATTDNRTIWHNTPERIGQGGGNWGENVAASSGPETMTSLLNRWLNSPGHRANIHNGNFTHIAIGYANADVSGWRFATVNFYGRPYSAGAVYRTGAEWLTSLNVAPTPTATPSPAPSASPSAPPSGGPVVNVYLTPGTHVVNGRSWRTTCEPYSQTKRCTTSIWATQTQRVGDRYITTNGWVFNNLTYAPSARSLWRNNPLGGNGVVGARVTWTSGGRAWRTECDTALTGRNGCRSFATATVVERQGAGYRTVTKEVFNNMVLFA